MSDLKENASKLIARYSSGTVDQLMLNANKRTREQVGSQTPMVMKRQKENVTGEDNSFDKFTDDQIEPMALTGVVQPQRTSCDEFKVTSEENLEKRIALLEEKADAVDRYKRYADGLISSKDNELASLKKELEMMKTALDEAKSEMGDEISELKKQNDKLGARCKQLENIEKSQAVALAKSSKQCATVASELEHANSEIADKDAEIERIDAELTATSDKLKLTMQKLSKAEREKTFMAQTQRQLHTEALPPVRQTAEYSQEIAISCDEPEPVDEHNSK